MTGRAWLLVSMVGGLGSCEAETAEDDKPQRGDHGGSGGEADGGGSGGSGSGAGVGGDDMGGEALEPDQLAPCEVGTCWDTALPVQECRSDEVQEDYSTGNYNVHRYTSSAAGGAETRIRLERTGGDWDPALVLSTLGGVTLSDGAVGHQGEDLVVDVISDGLDGSTAEVWLVGADTTGLLVHTTGWSVIDSGFVDFLPTDATYTLSIQSECEGGEPLDCTGGVVNGNSVAEPACGWLEFMGREVVPRMDGERDDRLDRAAAVAWWSLKEGVLFLEDPLSYSNCNFESGDEHIGPLESCVSGRAWQVGISGVQVPTFLSGQPEAEAVALYPSLSEDEVLQAAATEALLTPDQVDDVVASTGELRVSWLLRDSAIGVTLQYPLVERECIEGSYSWCYGTGWSSTSLYAPDKSSAMQAIEDIRALLDSVAP